LLRYDGIGADSEIPSAPAPVTRGYLLALLCGATVVPAPGPGRTSAASSPIEAPRGRPCRRDGEDADMSARAEMSAVQHAPSGDGAEGPGRRSGGGALASSLLRRPTR